MKSKILQFLTPSFLSNCVGKSSYVLVVVQEFVLASYFVGSLLTFLKQHGLQYFPVTRGGILSCQEYSNPLFQFYTTMAEITK
jgi:hypothetical protein